MYIYMPHITAYTNEVSHQSETYVDQLNPLLLIIDHLYINLGMLSRICISRVHTYVYNLYIIAHIHICVETRVQLTSLRL